MSSKMHLKIATIEMVFGFVGIWITKQGCDIIFLQVKRRLEAEMKDSSNTKRYSASY